MIVGDEASNDIDFLRQWIGRTQEAVDVITPRLVESLAATVGASPRPADEAPPAVHWCLSPAIVAADRLGSDGHPARGGFLPPVALPRRMWAGGEIRFLSPLRVGDEVTRTSRIADVTWKSGRSGDLCFVAVDHEYRTWRGVALNERHDIVYRQDGGRYVAPSHSAEPEFDHRQPVGIDAVTLFRYSAVTFNGHRIHYDADYASNAEGYPGLVIHGPLQATMLLNLAIAKRGTWPVRFAYRGVRPIFSGDAVQLNLRNDGAALSLWTSGADPAPAMTATAHW